MIDLGNPKLRNTVSKNIFATSGADAVVFIGSTRIDFENRSTNTTIAVFSDLDNGRSIMKSIEIDSQGREGMSSGCRGPWYFFIIGF